MSRKFSKNEAWSKLTEECKGEYISEDLLDFSLELDDIEAIKDSLNSDIPAIEIRHMKEFNPKFPQRNRSLIFL